MSTKHSQKKSSRKDDPRVMSELLEIARSLGAHGLITKTEMAQIRGLFETPPDFPPERVVKIRKNQSNMSQAVFASFLNVSVSAVQKWESPESGKHPSGAAAKLLQIIERKGIDAIVLQSDSTAT